MVQSGTLQLVEPFLRSRDPETFGRCDSEHIHGQSDEWVQRLVPLLRSSREEALSLAAFHFAMEAGIRQKKGDTSVSGEGEGDTSVRGGRSGERGTSVSGGGGKKGGEIHFGE